MPHERECDATCVNPGVWARAVTKIPCACGVRKWACLCVCAYYVCALCVGVHVCVLYVGVCGHVCVLCVRYVWVYYVCVLCVGVRGHVCTCALCVCARVCKATHGGDLCECSP